QTGVDFMVRISGSGTGAVSVNLFDCSAGCTTVASGATVATANNVTEVGVPFADLGITGPCTGGSSCTIPSSLYFDNQDLPNDDDVPALSPQIPGPTAVTLQNVGSGQSAVLPFALSAFGLIVVSAGLVINRKRKTVN
ncbi:MAG: hypothetical protein P8183_21155, partial [Anaerolineae bacterium]